MLQQCIFCWENVREYYASIIVESEWNYVVYDLYPVTKGHVLIISKQHFDNWFSLPPESQIDSLRILNEMKERLDQLYAPDGYNVGINCGKHAGQTIFHHHLHLIPRYEGDCSSPVGGVRGVIQEKKNYKLIEGYTEMKTKDIYPNQSARHTINEIPEIIPKKSECVSPKKRVIIFVGAPGAGKGTQCIRLSNALGIPHISTGMLFKNNDSEQGKIAKSYIESGKLVPDPLVLTLLFERIAQTDCANGYLLDGFPRTVIQAQSLDEHISKDFRKVVFNLEVSDQHIIKRLAGRLNCSACGNVHNEYFSPPSLAGHCDQCRGPLGRRSDDNAEIVQERLRVYHAQTRPLIHYFEQQDVIKHIDGQQDADEIYFEIKQVCSEEGAAHV